MTFFMKSGSEYFTTNEENIQIFKQLPALTYSVKKHPISGQYNLSTEPNFTYPPKVYGNTTKNVDRVINTHKNRNKNTGVLLSGEKGSGKTLMAKLISAKMREANVPTLFIDTPHSDDAFLSFLREIEQSIVVIFDEFEKMYDSKAQERILGYLDGMTNSNNLNIVTCNNRFGLSDFMINRPSRFFYNFEYYGLEEDFIREYCEEKLENKSSINELVQVSKTFNAFNFDILQSIVEEMNRYDESAFDVIKILNARPTSSNKSVFEAVEAISILLQKPVKIKHIFYGSEFNPFEQNFHVAIEKAIVVDDKCTNIDDDMVADDLFEEETIDANFTSANLVSISDGIFTFNNGSLILKMKKKERNYSDLRGLLI